MLDTVQEFRLPEGPTERSPTSPAHSCLVQIHPLQFSNSLIELNRRNPVTLGRSTDSTLELHDEFVSREHSIIEWDEVENSWIVADLGSRNGTFVNDRRVERSVLTPGDHVRLGSHIFKFLSEDHVEAVYHETVYQMMTVDALTQAHNRRYFEDAFERELQRSVRFCRPLAVLLFDLDRFKAINDQHGHLVGDEVLQGVCQRVRRRVRRDELFARYGGEEFAIVLAETRRSQAISYAEEVRTMIADAPVPTSRGDMPVTVSIGVAHTNAMEPVTAAELLSRADECLYAAKNAGRNCVRSDRPVPKTGR
jgi:two-component system, cell cycle response regulator